MRKRTHFHRGRFSEPMGFNATPMVDVIFMLTIFFMLVSHFSSAEQVPMQLPQPLHSQARPGRLRDRVVINCRLAGPAGSAEKSVLYSIGPNRPEPLDVIADRLAQIKRETPHVKVVIRADRRIPYEKVRRVMRLVAESGMEMLNVAAHVAEEK